MTDSTPIPQERREPGGPPGLPRWVKLLALAGAIALVVLVAAMLLAGGDHGPGMHG